MNWNKRIVVSEKAKKQMTDSFDTPFNNLKTVHIAIQSIEDINCDLRCEFIFELVSQLKNIENVKFIGRGFINVDSVLFKTPKIRRLCIAETDFPSRNYVPQLRKFHATIRTVMFRREKDGKGANQLLLHLNVNSLQWQDLHMLETYFRKGRLLTTCIENKR